MNNRTYSKEMNNNYLIKYKCKRKQRDYVFISLVSKIMRNDQDICISFSDTILLNLLKKEQYKEWSWTLVLSCWFLIVALSLIVRKSLGIEIFCQSFNYWLFFLKKVPSKMEDTVGTATAQSSPDTHNDARTLILFCWFLRFTVDYGE